MAWRLREASCLLPRPSRPRAEPTQHNPTPPHQFSAATRALPSESEDDSRVQSPRHAARPASLCGFLSLDEWTTTEEEEEEEILSILVVAMHAHAC